MSLTGFNRRRRRAKQKEKEKQVEKEVKKPEIVGFTELNAKDSQKAISNIDDLERLEKLLAIELENKDRKTVREPLEAKIAELKKEE